MTRRTSSTVTHGLALAVALAVLAACSNSPVGPQVPDNAAEDFGLEDVNPTSARSGELVSPRDYLGEVSAWYFGHST